MSYRIPFAILFLSSSINLARFPKTYRAFVHQKKRTVPMSNPIHHMATNIDDRFLPCSWCTKTLLFFLFDCVYLHCNTVISCWFHIDSETFHFSSDNGYDSIVLEIHDIIVIPFWCPLTIYIYIYCSWSFRCSPHDGSDSIYQNVPFRIVCNIQQTTIHCCFSL